MKNNTKSNLKGRTNLKIRKLVRNKLPSGRYKFVVIFNVAAHQLRSKKYNITKSYNRLVKYASNREKQKVRTKLKTYHFSRYNIPNTVWSIDKIEDDLSNFSIGKTKISYRNTRNRPLYVYLTDIEDITILLMNYQNIIFRIYEILLNTELKE